MHQPALLTKVIEFLRPRAGQFIIDGTFGAGGHAREIASRLAPGGTLLGIEWDPAMYAKYATAVNIPAGRVVVVNDTYARALEILREEQLPPADGLLLDVGFASDQLEMTGRGFSFKTDEPLRMTYNPEQEPVQTVVRRLSEPELADIIFHLGGERYARRIAKQIKEQSRRRLDTTAQLREAILRAVPAGYERGRLDPATRTFQALRIYVNRELENLEKILRDVPRLLRPGGRVVVLSFHSLEDRIVKTYFREMERAGVLRRLAKKAIQATEKEIRANPRSRSAKLRAAELV